LFPDGKIDPGKWQKELFTGEFFLCYSLFTDENRRSGKPGRAGERKGREL
jgi:hypothetical protein